MVQEGKIRITPKGTGWFATGHPWVFTSDLDSDKPPQAGVVSVVDAKGRFLAKALYSPKSKIALRVLTRTPQEIDRKFWHERIVRSIARRKILAIPSDAFRLVNAEADGLPSLIVDRYGDFLAVQFLSAGVEFWKETILDILEQELAPKGIIEKDDHPVRDLEGLPHIHEVVRGTVPEVFLIREGDLQFIVKLKQGQKTAAFLDQRDNRLRAGSWARGRVLDAFAYHGWFACQMAQRAEEVVCVESSTEAAVMIRENAKQNGLSEKITVVEANAFDWLREAERNKGSWNAINLDPPPFVKSKSAWEGGRRGYKEINLRAIKMLREREGLLITSSCSGAFSAADFESLLWETSVDAKVDLQIVGRHGAAPDHPALASLPESGYLKCLFCRPV